MRIVGGQLKGRALIAPTGQNTRPTSDRVREALFNILEHAPWMPAMSGLRVMDNYAGSGSLGLEALSRGASFCLFVEIDDEARGALRENIETLGQFGTTRIHRRDATDLGMRLGPKSEQFDLVFMDPPYHKGLCHPTLKALVNGEWLSDSAIIVMETGAQEPQFYTPDWDIILERVYGAAKLTIIMKKILQHN